MNPKFNLFLSEIETNIIQTIFFEVILLESGIYIILRSMNIGTVIPRYCTRDSVTDIHAICIHGKNNNSKIFDHQFD